MIRLVLGGVTTLIGVGIVAGPALMGAVAGWLPANRASRMDPTRVLHDS